MARRRRKSKRSGFGEALYALCFVIGGWMAIRSGGSPTQMMQTLAIWMGASFVACVGVLWLVNRHRQDRKPPPDTGRAVDVPTIMPVSTQRDVLDEVREHASRAANTMVVEAPEHCAWSLNLLRSLDWARFEEVCEGFWKAKGYDAHLTGFGADGGVDVVIRDRLTPERAFAVIQCKAKSSRIGVEPVRALWGSKDHFGAKLAIFYSVSGFTPDASAFATDKMLKLISGAELVEQLSAIPEADSAALLAHVTRGDYTTPTCPKCGEKMVRRSGTGDRGDFWGCRTFRACKTRPIPVRAG